MYSIKEINWKAVRISLYVMGLLIYLAVRYLGLEMLILILPAIGIIWGIWIDPGGGLGMDGYC